MADRDTLFFKTPAACHNGLWKEALPIGNGKIGAGILGGVKFETVYINRYDLWHWGNRDPLPDVSYHLEETRRLLDAGRYREANDILTGELSAKGYGPQFFVPMILGDLAIAFHREALFRKYRRMLRMDTGEAIVQYRQDGAFISRKAFLSRADEVLVYEVASDGAAIIGMDISLQMHKDYQKGTDRMKEELAPSLQIKVKDREITYSAQNEDQTDFGMVLRVLDCDGTVQGEPEKLVISDASHVLLVLKTFAKEEKDRAFERVSRELGKLCSCSYEALLKRHEAVHRPLYESAAIILGDEETPAALCNEELLLKAYEGEAPNLLLEKLWKFGRYLFLSGTDPLGLPFPLYGLWHGEYALPWIHHMANENIQMIYWHAAAGGLVDFLKAFIDYYVSMMDDFRENAGKLFGCRGIYISAGTVPGLGLANMMVPVIANWISAAGWIGQHFYTYYQYTGDKDMLKNRILPFLYETALFYEDYLVLDKEGIYKIFPSVSPENTPGNLNGENFQHMAHACPTAINATMDIAIIREVLQNLIRGAKELGCYKEDIPRWQEMLQKLPPYLKNPDGSIKEWSYEGLEDFNYHRHLSHLYPVFPGSEVSERKNKELLQGFGLSLQKRILGGQTGWSLAHMSNLYCRLKQPEKALECLDIMARSCLLTNFFTLHNDWRRMGLTLDLEDFTTIQLDALMGAVNALQEMLLYAEKGYVKILPCLPERFETGKVCTLHFPAGIVSFEWDQRAGRLRGEIFFNRSMEIVVDFPEEFGAIEVKSADCKVCRGEREEWHICGTTESHIYFQTTGRML